MTSSQSTLLDDRAVLEIKGADAKSLLQGLVTVDLDRLDSVPNVFGALLAPQGKIQFDFFLHPSADGLFIDIDNTRAADFLKRLTLYRLRSDVTLADRSSDHHVLVTWGGDETANTDARFAALGTRHIVTTHPDTNSTPEAYHLHRTSLGIPEAGKDFSYDDIFPHDAMMDLLGGVDFDKGCYVGQEVVSRMKHRGTARKRFFIATVPDGMDHDTRTVTQGEKQIGTIGSIYRNQTVALLRTDRLKEGDVPPSVGDMPITVTRPPYFQDA